MKWKNIIKNAEKIKKGIETENRLPTIEGYNYAELIYVFCKAVQSPNNPQAYKKVAVAPNPTGNAIKNNLTKKEYITLTKNVVKFIDERDKCPNYVTYQKFHIRPRLLLYCLSKILVFYHEHNDTYPITCWFKSTDVEGNGSANKKTTTSTNTSTSNYKKYGHSTEHCCEAMGQNNSVYCGDHSLQEVFLNLTGKVVSQDTIAIWAGTTDSGTDHDGLNTAVATFNRQYGYNLEVNWEHFSDIGWSGIKKIIDSNNQDCIIHNLYRNQWGHYEVINNVYDDYSDVQNSLGDRCSNGCYYGYEEERYHSTFRSYISGISQKSVMVITRK